jgi:hypothetical protein
MNRETIAQRFNAGLSMINPKSPDRGTIESLLPSRRDYEHLLIYNPALKRWAIFVFDPFDFLFSRVLQRI